MGKKWVMFFIGASVGVFITVMAFWMDGTIQDHGDALFMLTLSSIAALINVNVLHGAEDE